MAFVNRSLVLVCLLWILDLSTAAQDKRVVRRAWKDVPTSIEDCLDHLNILFSDSAKSHFISMDEAKAASYYNMTTGIALGNNWKLWWGSDLADYFNERGVNDPEDMTYLIFTSYHRKLKDHPVDFEGQLRWHHELVEEAKRDPPMPIDQFHLGDTVETVRYDSKRSFGMNHGKQAGYEITAIVQERDTVANTFRIRVMKIARTDTAEREEVTNYMFEDRPITSGVEFWVDSSWWRKRGEILLIHVD